MLHIEDYNNTIMIDNDIKEIIIDVLTESLDNIPPTVNKITIKKSINIYKRQHRIPYGCEVVIENIRINDIIVFNNMKEEDYLDITELGLYNNKITVIPEEIQYLTNLHTLDLYNNQITVIPEIIGSLENVVFQSSLIKIKDFYYGSLHNLRNLYLSHNKIVVVPEEIKYLTNLQILDLSNNKILVIPEEIINCRKLTKFNYYNNRIEVLDIKIIQFIERINNYQNHGVLCES